MAIGERLLVRCDQVWMHVREIRVHVTAFRALYYGTALATFRHSTIGFASVENGSLLWGALSAAAVDIAMLLAAEKLQERVTGWLLAGLIIATVGSVYSQALYMVSHAAVIEVAMGATWMQWLARWIIDLRIVILPVVLPLQVVVFAIASHHHDERGHTVVARDASDHTVLAGLGQGERCAAVMHIAPEATNAQVAAVVGCSASTASRARQTVQV